MLDASCWAASLSVGSAQRARLRACSKCPSRHCETGCSNHLTACPRLLCPACRRTLFSGAWTSWLQRACALSPARTWARCGRADGQPELLCCPQVVRIFTCCCNSPPPLDAAFVAPPTQQTRTAHLIPPHLARTLTSTTLLPPRMPLCWLRAPPSPVTCPSTAGEAGVVCVYVCRRVSGGWQG